jgi:hypothetical protein
MRLVGDQTIVQLNRSSHPIWVAPAVYMCSRVDGLVTEDLTVVTDAQPRQFGKEWLQRPGNRPVPAGIRPSDPMRTKLRMRLNVGLNVGLRTYVGLSEATASGHVSYT